mgnify:CR=1 FL=1
MFNFGAGGKWTIDYGYDADGTGVAFNDVALIRFINSVLDQRRTGGAWQASYNTWLAPYLGKGTAPAPQYGR